MASFVRRFASNASWQVRTLQLRARSPNLNDYAERWVRLVKQGVYIPIDLLRGELAAPSLDRSHDQEGRRLCHSCSQHPLDARSEFGGFESGPTTIAPAGKGGVTFCAWPFGSVLGRRSIQLARLLVPHCDPRVSCVYKSQPTVSMCSDRSRQAWVLCATQAYTCFWRRSLISSHHCGRTSEAVWISCDHGFFCKTGSEG